jgi:hypothetical protein
VAPSQAQRGVAEERVLRSRQAYATRVDTSQVARTHQR